ncbi:MAG: glycosyltransferase family 4 protein [Patescibacteria group bacterium]|jgi:glycosyltransferase involved in cell wall biosynthesis
MAQPSKILYLVTQSEWGGAQRYIFDLATHLASDYKVAVAAGGNDELFAKLDEKNVENYKLKNLVRQINLTKDIQAYFEIKKLIKKIKPDILHLNSSKAGVIGAIAGRHANVKKIIYTVHGFVFNEPMAGWQKQIYIWAEKFSAKYKDKLICVSEYDRQVGIKNKITSADKLITINNGIEPISFLNKATARQQLNLPPDKIIVGTIANFYLTKGLAYLITAAKEIIKIMPDVIFRLIGFGRLENQLKTEIKKLNLENKIYLGKVENAKEYLLAFDLFVLPSVKEGFSYTILEAMQAGLPIVATLVGGLPEMISDSNNGLLVPPADPNALAQAIIKLLENKDLATQLGNQAKIDVNQKFSLAKMISETAKVYQS